MSWLTNLFGKINSALHSPALENAEKTIAALLPSALQVVQAINAIVPNKTLAEIEKAYETYAVPFSQTYAADPVNGPGNALLNLATAILQKNKVMPAAVSIIQSAIQLAVVAAKANPPVAPAVKQPTA